MLVTRRRALGALAAGGAGLLGAGGYGVLVERHRLGVTRATISLRRLPPGLDGLRVGLATDFHYGRFTGDEMVAAVAQRLAEERLDLVLLGGDFVTWSDRAAVAPCAAALAGVRARLGVFAVFGNHDPEGTVKAVFERRGVGVLRDQHTRLDVRGEPVALAGLRYWSSRPADLDRALRGSRGFPILLAHDPRRVDLAAAAAVPLVLSGHTHGGQVVVPGLGAPAAARYPVVHGLGRRGGTALFVSRGIGTVVVPVRFNCPPEVVILTLRTART
ncbi:MAG: putative metallophosphoesterase [Acidobacteria bacterium]|nr:putative metallophosphoesterase [Acidobacteriota bacterium]